MICRRHCFDNGLVMRRGGDMIIAPPLIMDRSQIDQMMDLIRLALDKTLAEAARPASRSRTEDKSGGVHSNVDKLLSRPRKIDFQAPQRGPYFLTRRGIDLTNKSVQWQELSKCDVLNLWTDPEVASSQVLSRMRLVPQACEFPKLLRILA